MPSFNPVEIRNGLSECNTAKNSDYAVFVQRLTILVQTSMAFRQRWVDVRQRWVDVPTSRIHWEVTLQGSRAAF